MFNFLNNYNKFLFASTGRYTSSVDSNEDLNARLDELNGDEENLDTSSVQKSKSKKSALKTAGENLVQNTKQLGSLAKENITGIAFASAGTALTGFGVYKIIDEISKTRASVFSDKAHKFHEFYNANKEILGIPGVDSFLSGTNKELILNFLNLKDQSLINTLLGNQSLFTNNNALSLFQNDSFLNLINPQNSESLNLLFNNISLFTNKNIDLVNVMMENQGLQTLLNNDAFKNLLNDEKFLSLLQDPEGLKKFFQGAQQLVDDKYLNVLNDPVLSGIFKDSEIQNLLTNPEMLAMLKNPEFFALFSDPNIAPFLTNPDFQALLINNPDLIKTVLSNPDILKFLNTPEAIQMLQNPQLATLLQNQVSSDTFFEMFKNPEGLGNVLNSNDLTNYLEASANVGVSTGAIAGIIISILVGTILTGVGIKMFKDIQEKQKGKAQGGMELYSEIKTDKEKNKIIKLFDKIMNSISNLFTTVMGWFKIKAINTKNVSAIFNPVYEDRVGIKNMIIENRPLGISSPLITNLEKNITQDLILFDNDNNISKMNNPEIINNIIEPVINKTNEFRQNNGFNKLKSDKEMNLVNTMSKAFSTLLQDSTDKSKDLISFDKDPNLFNKIVEDNLRALNTDATKEQSLNSKITIQSAQIVEKPKEQTLE